MDATESSWINNRSWRNRTVGGHFFSFWLGSFFVLWLGVVAATSWLATASGFGTTRGVATALVEQLRSALHAIQKTTSVQLDRDDRLAASVVSTARRLSLVAAAVCTSTRCTSVVATAVAARSQAWLGKADFRKTNLRNNYGNAQAFHVQAQDFWTAAAVQATTVVTT